jgi:hypothetical protein
MYSKLVPEVSDGVTVGVIFSTIAFYPHFLCLGMDLEWRLLVSGEMEIMLSYNNLKKIGYLENTIEAC